MEAYKRSGDGAQTRCKDRAAAKAISVKAFTEKYSVGRTTTYSLIASGELETAKVGSRRLILTKSAKAWFRNSIVRGRN